MRIALISDIHGNEIAFKAVIRDFEHVGVDRIVCLGDIATLGPLPSSVVQMLRQFKGNLIVNPGSVGLPFKEFVQGRQPEIMEHSEYAIIEMEPNYVNVSLRRVSFNRKKFWATIKNCKNPIQRLFPR